MNCRQLHCMVAFATVLALFGARFAIAAPPSYLETDARPSYSITPSGFTVECRVKVRSIPDAPGGAWDNPRILRCIIPRSPMPNCGDSRLSAWEILVCYQNCGGAMVTFDIMSAGICTETRAPWPMSDPYGWHHLAATFDGATPKVYIDGVLAGSQPCAAGLVDVTGGRLRVGDPYSGEPLPDIAAPFDGQIDEIRIWKVVRTQAEINANKSVEIPVHPDMVAYWRLNGDGVDLIAGQVLTPTGDVSYVLTPLVQGVDISYPGYPIANAGNQVDICRAYSPECSDGIDNDGDGCADYPYDSGCENASDNDESGGQCVPALTNWGLAVLVLCLCLGGALFLARRRAGTLR